MSLSSQFIFLVIITTVLCGYPEPGRYEYIIDHNETVVAPKSLFKGSQIFVQVTCTSSSPTTVIIVTWSLTESKCWDEYLRLVDHPASPATFQQSTDNQTVSVLVPPEKYLCHGPVLLPKMIIPSTKDPPNSAVPKSPEEQKTLEEKNQESVKDKTHPKEVLPEALVTIPKDGFYLLTIQITSLGPFSVNLTVETQGAQGYLSASDWPLLPFYAIMCLVYVILGLIWLIVSFCQWRDLLRIQFWIGGVIFLGMLEKAMFYAEYYSINKTGEATWAATLAAEWVSCAKRTLARMLVVIVSLGFGIVKPRLGPMLHRVVGVGTCYFFLACIESYIRVKHSTNDSSNQLLVASIPLAALDALISWWIFTALVQTTRTLRLRRNMVKLSLYRHFTNTLIFAVVASIIFMLYTMKTHRLTRCLTDWKELWVDDAFWHVLFSMILLAIMVLWRPTINNQRYAFTPLLDNADDDEEEDQFVNDAYGVKMRSQSRANSPKPKPSNEDEDILKWVDDNIPSAGVESALPILDSDEEVLTTRFEVSKML